MKFFIQNRIISALLIASCLLLGAYYFGLFEKQLNLLDINKHKLLQTIEYGKVEGSFEFEDKKWLKSSCKMPGSEFVDFCGMKIGLGTTINQGVYLSDYRDLEIELEMKAPVLKPRIKLSIRHFDPVYAKPDNDESLKFNSLVISPTNRQPNQSIITTIPLSYLYVETWWVNKFEVPVEHAQVDISNVSSIEIVQQDTSIAGDYEFSIKRLVLVGDRFTLTQLMIVNAIIWILIIYLLIKHQSETLRNLSARDLLTELPNRRGLQMWIDGLKISGQSPQNLSLFFIDIDDFKTTNDTFGHKAGDQLLIGFSQAISQLLKVQKIGLNKGVFCRMSGDEFVILLRDVSPSVCTKVAEKILQVLETPITIDEHSINIYVSIGSCTDQISHSDISQLTASADAAMYLAKKSGKNQYRAFSIEEDSDVIQHKSLAKIISDAMTQNQFDLKFMPIFDVKTKLVKNVEVLIRSDTPELARFSTKTIVKIAEDFKLIQELDEWVFKHTLELLSDNRELVERLGLTFCINVSTLDLQNRSFFQRTKQELERYQIPPSWIELEITENALTNSSEACAGCLHELKSLGVKLALDEFGTGYTAFNQLINYPVNKIKINSAYVSAIGHDDGKIKVLTDAIISIADSFDLQVTAVGIETLEQYYYFESKGCENMQGYLLSEPLTLRELVRGLRNQDTFEMTEKLRD